MIKNNNTKAAKSNSQLLASRIAKRFPLFAAGLLIVGLLGYFFIAKPVVAYYDKKKFIEARNDIEELATKIEATQKPDKRYAEDSCRYAGFKFEKGHLSCLVSIHLFYENSDHVRSNEMMTKISKIENLSPIKDRFGEESSFVSKDIEGLQGFSQNYLDQEKVPSCGIEYKYPRMKEATDPRIGLNLSSDSNLEVTLSCGGSARAEHFPIRN